MLAFLMMVYLLSPVLCGNSDLSPSQSQVVVMSSSQYHFVPGGSYLQYSLAGWPEGTNSKFIDRMTAQFNLSIITSSPQYNLLVFFTNSADSQAYTHFNCYVRAVNEGLSVLMSNCKLNASTVNAGGIAMTNIGKCSNYVSIAAESTFSFSPVYSFYNCTDQDINFTISSGQGVGPINGTILFVIDNSGLFTGYGANETAGGIKLILSEQLMATVNEEEKAKLYLFSGLAGILILIMIIIAVALNCKIRKLDHELKSTTERLKSE